MMVSCKAVGPGVSGEAGGGVDDDSGAGVVMVMGFVVADRTEADSYQQKSYGVYRRYEQSLEKEL
jgi:hypothetical protein